MNLIKTKKTMENQKSIIKRFFSSVLAVCMVISTCAISVSALFDNGVEGEGYFADVVGDTSGECGDTASWTLSSGGVLTVSGSGAMYDYTSPDSAPWYASRSSIKSIIIQSGITSIGKLAFNKCDNLTNVTIGKDVTTIGQSVFVDCKSLSSIDVVTSNKSFKSSNGVVYSYDGKTLVFCPNGKSGAFSVSSSVESIGDNAFEGCSNITEINLGNGVKSIGKSAFYACVGLKKFVIGKNLSTIGDMAFAYCDALSSFTMSVTGSYLKVEDGIIYSTDGKTLVCVPSGKSGAFTVKSGVEAVANYAAYRCTLITSITLSDTVKTVGEYAFSYCTSADTITFGSGMKTISRDAFSNCTALTKLTLNKGLETIGNNAFYGCENIRNVIVPDSTTTIGRSAFQRCYKLTNLWLGSGVTKVDSYAFCHCNYLKKVTILGNVTSIKSKAFGYTQTGSMGYTYTKVSDFEINGVKGSQAEAYATKEGFPFTEYKKGEGFFEPSDEPDVSEPDVSTPENDITKLPENDFYMDVENKVMPNVVHKTSASTMTEELKKYGVDVSIKDKNGNSLTGNSLVGTGSVVTNAKTGETFTVIVLGDLDGTATIDGTDYLQIKMIFLSRLEVSGVYFTAADCDGDKVISATDYLRIKGFFLGNYDLYA